MGSCPWAGAAARAGWALAEAAPARGDLLGWGLTLTWPSETHQERCSGFPGPSGPAPGYLVGPNLSLGFFFYYSIFTDGFLCPFLFSFSPLSSLVRVWLLPRPSLPGWEDLNFHCQRPSCVCQVQYTILALYTQSVKLHLLYQTLRENCQSS